MGEKNNKINANHSHIRGETDPKEEETLLHIVKIQSPFDVTTKCQRETKFVSKGERIAHLEIEILPEFLMGEIKKNASSELATYEAVDKGNKCQRTTRRCFFQLRSTDPSIILGFIDIIRVHPCQWNVQQHDFDNKDKRDRSTVIICEQMQRQFNLSISPQLVRSSILSLMRWFKHEYLRSQQVAKSNDLSYRDGYVCAHPTYFNKLKEFLPHKHLKLTSCNECQRRFKTQNQLLLHNHQVHGANKPFQCRYCKRSFLHPSTWKHHENRHTKIHVWKCELCSHISSTKSDHNIHMVTHSDIRAFVCDLCGSSYKSSTSLNVHLRTHEAPKLQCPLCNQMFYENYRLKRHLWTHEAEHSVKAETNIALNLT